MPPHNYVKSIAQKIDRQGFVLKLQLELLEKALVSWPRRNAPLLEVNCGDGRFLPFLWQSGFDIVATESDASQRRKAASLAISGLDIYAASDDDLPFEDDSFDWVVTHIRHGANESLKNCVAQALRVAKRGFMLTFWNSSSIPAWYAHLRNKQRPWLRNATPWSKLMHMLAALGSERRHGISTLCAPECTWGGGTWATRLNSCFPGSSLGAWAIIRSDLAPLTPVTPLPLRLRGGMENTEPIFEYVSKDYVKISKKDKS